jgi:predicted O-methyltransferase YrrM
MNAEELLNQIFTSKKVSDKNGNEYPSNSGVSKEEGEFIKNIIHKYNAVKTIEVGCAHGLSSLYICSSIKDNPGCSHTIIDPSQSNDWKGIGISNLEKVGYNFFKLIEKPSEIALPELLSSGEKFDLGFIDGWHTFDHTLIDFFYLNRLINIGGIIIIDDIRYPSISKLMRYIINYPCYEMIGHVGIEKSKKRKLYDLIDILPFRIFSKLFPRKLRYKYFSSKIINSDKELNLQSSMVAFRKISDDERSFRWFKEF